MSHFGNNRCMIASVGARQPSDFVNRAPARQMTTAEAATEMLDSPAAERRRWSLRRLLAVVAVVLALLSAFLTFVVLTGLTPIIPTHEIVITFLGINSATILLLLTIIGVEVWQVVQARRRGRAASRLHIQIVALFSVIAVLPAVLVAAVANVTLDRGLDRLFNTRTKAVIENSVVVAHAYLQENARQIYGDVVSLANEL